MIFTHPSRRGEGDFDMECNEGDFIHEIRVKRKLMGCSHCQESGQLADLASDGMFTLV